jgi:hypothetical protein
MLFGLYVLPRFTSFYLWYLYFSFLQIRLCSGSYCCTSGQWSLDPVTRSQCKLLMRLGDAWLGNALAVAQQQRRRPYFIERVPVHLIRALRRAFSELFLCDELSLLMSYFNKTSPFIHPDRRRINKAMLLFPTPQLIRRELCTVTEYNHSLRHELNQVDPEGLAQLIDAALNEA